MAKSKKQVAPKKLKKQATSKVQKEQEAEVKRQRGLVKNVLFPFLAEKTKSVVEAKRLCHEVQQLLTQTFQQKVAAEQQKFSELKTSEFPITDILKKGDGFKLNQELAALFKDEKLMVTNALLGGMGQALDSFVNEEMNSRHVNSLKTTFLD